MYNHIPDSEKEYLIADLGDNIVTVLSKENTCLTLKKEEHVVNIDPLPYNLTFMTSDKKLYIVSRMHIGKNARRIFIQKIIKTYSKIVNNAIKGLEKNYEKRLTIIGVGYKFYDEQSTNGCIKVAIGYSHPVLIKIIDGVKVSVMKDNVNLLIVGPDKFLIGLMASKFMFIKKFNRYSMNGIKYSDANIKKK